jgi:hypothetical protein
MLQTQLKKGTTVKIGGIPLQLLYDALVETNEENYRLLLSQDAHGSLNPAQALGLVSAETSNLSLAPI